MNDHCVVFYLGFPGSPVVKNQPAMQEIWVQSLGQEDVLEKEMATHSSIFVWEIPWTEEPGRLKSMGLQRVEHDSNKTTVKTQSIMTNDAFNSLVSDIFQGRLHHQT